MKDNSTDITCTGHTTTSICTDFKKIHQVSDKKHCKQKLRSKNISQNGNCSVCENFIENVKASHTRIDEKKRVKKLLLT